MAYLILIRHSISQQQPGVSAHEWTLTEAGRARCTRLAAELRPYQPAVIVSSEEPKARLTAGLVAHELGLPTETEFGLHEQKRATAPYSDAETFRASIQRLLTEPDSLVFGEETGSAARERFVHAVTHILARHPGQTVAAVTHGTVLALYLAQAAGLDPVAYWRSLGMPAYIVLTLPDYRVAARVDEVV